MRLVLGVSENFADSGRHGLNVFILFIISM